eukprot:CAMPEP_0194106404 /NCGR_PEP_ID=MMETSP0150-20130528/6423_1 /TAXON_ID=122233 /ORGANISM="Chaetoceros debilis, Strain MM31A-1" /LENGTH=276 /DNA_ID=CAMNT_0038794533 /DNA_START=325 /DNA_END=1155 /DNA_ORIENTATION=+
MDAESAIASLFADGSCQKHTEFEKDSQNYWVEFREGRIGDETALASLLLAVRKTPPPAPKTEPEPILPPYEQSEHNESPTATDVDTDPDVNPEAEAEADTRSDGKIESESEPIDTTTATELESSKIEHIPEVAKENNNKKENAHLNFSDLELNLANGFGDEQTPPAFHAILAEVCCHIPHKGEEEDGKVDVTENHNHKEGEEQRELCGVAIATIDWDIHRHLRYLRVEELEVDGSKFSDASCANLILRRLVLSLSALALKSGCDGLHMKESSILEV